jgi:hypothetical protein
VVAVEAAPDPFRDGGIERDAAWEDRLGTEPAVARPSGNTPWASLYSIRVFHHARGSFRAIPTRLDWEWKSV